MSSLSRRGVLRRRSAPRRPHRSVRAQAWPARPVTFVVPFAPGGGNRRLAPARSRPSSKPRACARLIDNRAGAGGTVGAGIAAARAAPDGHTFLVGAAHHAIAPSLYPRLDYDILTDLVPVGMISRPPQVVVVNPQRVQARTLQELIAFARANPDQLNYASAGAGTTHHLAASCSSR